MPILGIMLSAVHLAAWNWQFPSHAELWLWRVSCLFLIGSCMPFFIYASGWFSNRSAELFVAPGIPIYILARLIIIVQIFLCFRKMPESVYTEVPWSYWERYIPHLAWDMGALQIDSPTPTRRNEEGWQSRSAIWYTAYFYCDISNLFLLIGVAIYQHRR